MLQLPVLEAHAHFQVFGSAARPLRPSKVHRLLTCPMSVFLDTDDSVPGNQAAQTGNLVHSAVAKYHKTAGSVEARTKAGLKALADAREQFPDGDPKAATVHFQAYAQDPKNSEADVAWCEEPVRLTLDSPDGVPIIIEGTLDQVRRKDGILSVWDVKTGGRLTAATSVEEYLVQQAIYVLAARETLDPSVEPGGLIHTPGYAKKRGITHPPLKIGLDQCIMLMHSVVDTVLSLRAGHPAFRPSYEACQYCPLRPFTHCFSLYNGVFK